MNFLWLCLNIFVGVILAIAPPVQAELVNYRTVERFKGKKETETVQPVRFKRLNQDGALLYREKQMPQDTGSYSARVIQRDYEVDRPLPMTGQTTIVDFIDRLNLDRMFEACPDNSQLIEFAESQNFLVQICLKETKDDSTVFWMGSAKDGRGSLTVQIDRNLEFWNVDTYYAIERRHEEENSYLLIGWPNGNLEAEALLYYYYPCFGDDC